MSEMLVVIDVSEIRAGKLDEVREAIRALVDFVDRNEPRVLAYSFYLDEDGATMTVLQIHPDSASMELHMEIAAPVFRRFVDLITLRTMDVYGVPSERLLEQLRAKMRLLGTATSTLHVPHAGIVRALAADRAAI